MPASTAAAGLTPFWPLSLAVLGLDQITKLLVTHFVPMYSSRTVIPGIVDIVHVQNAGVAFGLFNDVTHPLRSLVTIALACAALVGIGYYARQLKTEERLARIGLSLILGGAVGNLVDRIRQGFVTDFIDVYWGDWHFWAFNAADSAITVGACLIILELLVSARHAPRPL
jgi:signal peptidase II